MYTTASKKKNLALTKNTGQKVQFKYAKQYKHAITNSQQHAYTH